MNRGKTALKRGVAVASAAAIAIAGAVLAAPAASAAPTSTDSIRATPTADANWVNSDGTASSTYVGGAPYSPTTPTGTAVLLKPGVTNQAASGFQIALPAAASATGNLTVTLVGGATWAAPANINVDSVERVGASLNTSAGIAAGANSHVAQALSGGVALPVGAVGTPTAAGAVLTVPVGIYTGTAGGVYVLTFQNVRLSVPATVTSATTIEADLASTATFNPAGLTGKTTLGYVSPLSISVASGSVAADSTGAVSLPNIVVSENVKGAIAAGSLVLTLSSSGATAIAYDATATPTASATGTGLAIGGVTKATGGGDGTLTIPVTTASTTAGSVTVSGVKLTGVDKNATITVSVTTPTTSATAANAGTNFSFAPSLDAVSADVATVAPEPRIAGTDRYDTAAKVLANGITNHVWTVGTTNAVVIANGETAKIGADALSSNYLANFEKAPILLTTATSLPVSTQTALISLFKSYNAATDINVYVMGKTDSVSAAVRAQIQSIIATTAASTWTGKVNIVSVAGDNRYQTSAAAATTVGASGLTLHSLSTTGAWLPTAFLASGTVNADALAAGSVSGAAGIPVLLTSGTALDAKVSAAIKNLGIQQVIVLGGTDRVSAALVTSLSSLGVTSTTRIAGSDRYTTAADLYTWAFADVNPSGTVTSRGLGWGTGVVNRTAYIANGGAGFPDALSVGPLAAAGTNPILTTGAATLAPAAASFLTTNKADFATNGFWALGQKDRISSAVITAIQTALK